MNIILWVIFGAIAGWAADTLMSSDHGVLEDIILGIVGAFIGGLLFNIVGQSGVTGFNIYSFVVAIIGAAVLIYLGRLVHR